MHRERLADAAYRLLEALDDLDEVDFHAMERAVHREVRRAAAPSALNPAEVWEHARRIETDPLARQRPVLGEDWRPRFT